MTKYTRELLAPLVAASDCVSEVLRKLGMNAPGGSTHTHVSRAIKAHGLDTSHFVSLKIIGRPGLNKLPWQKLLTQHTRRLDSKQLRRAMIESGIEHKCCRCGLGPVWCDEPLVLQIEHRNGDGTDCRQENLEFRCPNCHTQTPTYGKVKTSKQPRRCGGCGGKIRRDNKSGYCVQCYTTKMKRRPSKKWSSRHRMTPAIPTAEALLILVWTMPTIKVAASFGVSDKAVHKWCKKYGIPKPGAGYWMRSEVVRAELKEAALLRV